MHKVSLFLLLAVATVLSGRCEVMAQTASSDTGSSLRDAAYIFNRYEELTAGFDFDKLPEEIREKAKAATLASSRNEEHEKARLDAILAAHKWTSVDVLDAYDELYSICLDLQNLSDDGQSWGDSRDALELVRLSARAQVTAARLYVNLRSMLRGQETKLASCSKAARK